MTWDWSWDQRLASSQQEMTTVKGFTEAVRSQMVDLELMYSGYSGKSWLHQVKASGSLPKVTDSPGRFHKVVATVKGPHCMELWAPHAGNRLHKAKASPHSATGRKPWPESEWAEGSPSPVMPPDGNTALLTPWLWLCESPRRNHEIKPCVSFWAARLCA